MDFKIGKFEIEALDMPDAMIVLAERYARLLAVARAAKRILETASITYKYIVDEPSPRKELAEALAAVEDLLDG